VLLPLCALLAYWVGMKMRHGSIHIGVRPGGTQRGFVNKLGSTSPFHIRVRAKSRVEAFGDGKNKVYADLDKFKDPFSTIAEALRAA
jgi:hypothetical protein